MLYISCADGTILVWDFTDTSFGFSLALKATTARITSMDFLHSANSHRYQLLAVGDELGILHVFEIPRNLTKTSNKEMDIMTKFLDRELAVRLIMLLSLSVFFVCHHDVDHDVRSDLIYIIICKNMIIAMIHPALLYSTLINNTTIMLLFGLSYQI